MDAGSEPHIFKMIQDCFDELFEYLSVNDLKALRQTNKRMKRVVDELIKTNFSVTLQKFCTTRLTLIGTEIMAFRLVNHIDFSYGYSSLPQIEMIHPILPQAEIISIYTIMDMNTDWNIHDNVLKHCTKLKQLMISANNENIQNGVNWLYHVFPTLEHIGLYHCMSFNVACTDLEVFFNQNPSIKVFTVTSEIIWGNRDWIRKSNIKFDRLYIILRHYKHVNIVEFCDFLTELHIHGLYKELHVEIQSSSCQTGLPSIIKLCSLKGLFDCSIRNGTFLRSKDLEELDVKDVDESNSVWEMLAINLPNLRRISIQKIAKFDYILPFIQRCPNLKHIKIDVIETDGVSIINFTALNKERAKLENARNVMIFVDEDVFLTNKWRKNTNSRLVTLKRIHSWKESNPFYSF